MTSEFRRSEAAGTGPASEPLSKPGPPADVAAAQRLFGDRLHLAISYAELLATEGVLRGLIGPREAPRLWERHLLNCAAVAELIPVGACVVDVGSGAGLPGIVLAVARPDLSVTLVEPLARRVAFLEEAVTALGLTGAVTVLRARAEECVGQSYAGSPSAGPASSGPASTWPAAGAGPLVPADIVTARAVAPLDRLAGWCLPLTAVGGRLLALKGATAAAEVADHRDAIGRLGGGAPIVRLCGVGLIDPPTTVVDIVRERDVVPPRPGPARKAARRSHGSGSERGSARGRPRRK